MSNTLITRIGGLAGASYVVIAILANDVFGRKSPDSTASAREIDLSDVRALEARPPRSEPST